jgi:hypothetical protein
MVSLSFTLSRSMLTKQTIISIFRLRRATSKAMYISNTLNQANGKLEDFDDQFLKMALRISMYPVTLIIVNGFISGRFPFHSMTDADGSYRFTCRECWWNSYCSSIPFLLLVLFPIWWSRDFLCLSKYYNSCSLESSEELIIRLA